MGVFDVDDRLASPRGHLRQLRVLLVLLLLLFSVFKFAQVRVRLCQFALVLRHLGKLMLDSPLLSDSLLRAPHFFDFFYLLKMFGSFNLFNRFDLTQF